MSERSTISFSYGISRNPSMSTSDGSLSECVNLIPRNGELVNIKAPVHTGATLDTGDTLIAMHTTSTGRRMIISNGTSLYYRSVDDSWTLGTKYKIADVTARSVDVMGNTLIVLTDSDIEYFVWGASGYDMIDVKNVDLSHTITITHGTYVNSTPMSLSITTPTMLKKEEISGLYGTIDQYNTGSIRNLYGDKFRKVHFGVLALRMYSGSYAFVSDVFMLSPKNEIKNVFPIENTSEGWRLLTYTLDYYSARISANIEDLNRDIFSGVDVFLTQELDFIDSNNAYYENGSLRFPFMGKLDAFSSFDNSLFYKVLTLTQDDLENTTGHDIPMPTGGEETLSLVDMGRMLTKARGSYVYNKRLIVYGVEETQSVNTAVCTRSPLDSTSQITSLGESPSYSLCDMLVVYDVTRNGNAGKSYEYICDVRHPYTHILTYPGLGCTSATIYLYVKQSGAHSVQQYYRKSVAMTQSSTRGICTYINWDNTPKLIWNKEGSTGWSSITRSEYLQAVNERSCTSFPKDGLMFTGTGDPFTFPLINNVQVGSGDIMRITSETLALSQDQFGSYTMTAFTTDGIWSLGVGEDGSITSSAPLSRDVCTNSAGILQLDSAVMFPTDQGLKILSGGQVSLMSNSMDGENESESLISGLLDDFSSLIVSDTDEFRSMIKGARMAYDYINNAVHFYTDSRKHYMLSLDGNEYTSYIGDVVKNVLPGFPGSILQMSDGRIMTYSNETRSGTFKGLLLTRPVCMGDPNTLKMIEDLRIMYTRRQGSKCRIAVFGSNDAHNFFRVTSLRMRPFIWYRFAVYTSMTDLDALTGISMTVDTRRTGKIR